MANEFKIKNGAIVQKLKPYVDSTTSFQINNAGDTITLINVDTTNNRVSIGKTGPGYTLDVNGTFNAPTIYENGILLTNKYLQLSGGTLTGGLTGTTAYFTGLTIDGTLTVSGTITAAGTGSVSTNWTDAYNKRIATFTTNGNSGAATFTSNTLNIPTYTLSGLGGQPQLNGTGFVKASGTTISYDNSTYITSSGSITGSAGSVVNNLVLKFDTGTTEGTSLYTYNGSTEKTIDIKGSTNVTLTESAGTVLISATDTTYKAGTGLTLTGTTFSVIYGTTAGSAAVGNHGHGNIGINGSITSITTPASGDYIILADSSNDSVLSSGIAIGTGTTTFLRNDGTWATPPQGTVTGTGTAGQVSFWTSSSAQSGDTNLYWDNTSKKLGIGTSTVNRRLTVIEGATADYQMRIGASDANSYDIGRSTSNGFLQFYGNQSGVNGYIFSGANGERMRIDAAGNMGVGTTAPAYKLHVNGSFAATTKSFVIEHPTKPDHYLRYGSLEGPENGVYVRGKLIGNKIYLPEYWTELIDEDTITVNLTPIGKFQRLWVKSIKDGIVTVSAGWFKTPNCYYVIFAERKDVEKLEVEIKNK